MKFEVDLTAHDIEDLESSMGEENIERLEAYLESATTEWFFHNSESRDISVSVQVM